MHGSVNGIYFVGQPLRHEIEKPDIVIIFVAGEHNRINGIIYEGVEFVVIILCHATETVFYILKLKNLMNIVILSLIHI